MRRFHLDRASDPSGVSGTGVVAEGIEFTDGSVALRWLSAWPSTSIYPDVATVETVHGHGGSTVVIWYDGPERAPADAGGEERPGMAAVPPTT